MARTRRKPDVFPRPRPARRDARRNRRATWLVRAALALMVVLPVGALAFVPSKGWSWWITFTLSVVVVSWLYLVVPAKVVQRRNQARGHCYVWRAPAVPESERQRAVFGDPGAGLMSGRFDPALAAAGLKGEQLTAALLTELLARFPTARVFHGMCWPAQESDADVDHAVLVGDRLALIDSKLWNVENVTWSDGTAWGDGRRYPLVLPVPLRQFQASFPSLLVDGWVAVHGSGRGVRVHAGTAEPPVHLVAAEHLLRELTQFFDGAKRPTVVRHRAVRQLRALVKSDVTSPAPVLESAGNHLTR